MNRGYGGTTQPPERKTHLPQCSILLLEDNSMAIEEFIKRFVKKSAFEALLIETRRKSTKSNTWNKVVIYEVLLPAISCQIRRRASPSVLA